MTSADGERAKRAFDALGAAYVARTERNAFNAAYERPVLRSLLPKVAGRVVLDAGCGGGAHAEWLADRGARVVAVDVSPVMVGLARDRLGSRAQVVEADLAEPLAFLGDGSIDVVVAALSLHHLAAWAAPVGELRRVLTPGGHLVLSVHHPLADWQPGEGDYFATTAVVEEWEGAGGRPVAVRSYRRPLSALTGDLSGAGFVIEQVEERPPPDLLRRFPEVGARLATTPWYLFLRTRRREGPGGSDGGGERGTDVPSESPENTSV